MPIAGSAAKGFSLVELLLAMLVGSLAIWSIYTAFQAQHRNYLAQDQVVRMQQNLRAAMDIMSREIRMAGFDDTERTSQLPTPASVLLAAPYQIVVSMDLNLNGRVVDPSPPTPDTPNTEPGEVVSFRFPLGVDAKSDGIADPKVGGAGNLGRDTGGDFDTGVFNHGSGHQPIAENIHAIGFAYAFDADSLPGLDFVDANHNGVEDPGEVIWAVDPEGDGAGNWFALDTNNDGLIDENDLAAELPEAGESAAIAGFDTGIPVRTKDVRAVRIWVLARAANPAPEFNNNQTYVVGRQVIHTGDNYRRRLAEVVINCRNMKKTLN